MRLAALAFSAVLLSGCSWLGGLSGSQFNSGFNAQSQYGGFNARGAQQIGAQQGCQILSVAQPIPTGCHPSEVTLAVPGQGYGFAQKPDFSNYTSGGYGSHAAQAGALGANYGAEPHIRKPKWRGSLSFGGERSISGDILDFSSFGGSAGALYNPDNFAEGRTSGSIASGNILRERYSADVEGLDASDIAFEDVHSTPVRIAGGVEYIHSPSTTVFANLGYSYAGGERVNGLTVIGELEYETISEDYDAAGALIGSVPNRTFIPNQEIANIDLDFSPLRRWDLEVGARKYFNPILTDPQNRTVTPFVGVSAGASHYNAARVDIRQQQVFFERAFNGNPEFYDVPSSTTPTEVYGAQWVPNGSLTAGMEWQVTPKTAFALESGLRYEGGRDLSNGENSQSNVVIPVTLRGSFNF